MQTRSSLTHQERATGKGHTLTTSATPTWIDGILSTDKSTEWK